MATERLHMNGEERYHGYEAAAHVARYALVRPLCAGRRVLDIACGEGYGSALLAGWGARHVTGMDIAADAIDAAQRNFADPAIRFLQGDAEQAAVTLRDEPGFDLVVSFETVEHVSDPAAFLNALRQLCAPGGSIFLSCPNDPATLAPGTANPFHARTYTFAQFRTFAEGILGPAAGWLIETPAIGLLHYSLDDAATESPAAGPADLVKVRGIDACLQLPAQAETTPSRQDCLAYIGMWGATVPPNCAIMPMSHSGYMYPWHRLDHLEREIDRRDRDQQADRRQLLHYAEQLAALRQAQAASHDEIHRLSEQAGRQAAIIGEQAAEIGAQAAVIGDQAAAMERHAAAVGQQTARLEQQSAAIAELTGQAAAAELRRQEIASRLEVTQVERDQARQWRASVERSPFYAMLRAYAGLYDRPVVGPAMTLAREGAARLLRRRNRF